MERLTRWNESTEMAELTSYDDYDWKEFWNKELLDDVDFLRLQPAFDKLAEYEDLEEQGLILKLPCKFGDLVYVLENCHCYRDFDQKCHRQRTKATKYIEMTCVRTEPRTICIKLCVRPFKTEYINKMGKTVFLTKEEAEEKLKELKNEKR